MKEPNAGWFLTGLWLAYVIAGVLGVVLSVATADKEVCAVQVLVATPFLAWLWKGHLRGERRR